ncbi:MAG: glycoside hydrolase family 5 protein [Melioribacteraceae bacterium]|nr:glycoside hydrolase family 5 protein [Melioribacteraceae bacterium]
MKKSAYIILAVLLITVLTNAQPVKKYGHLKVDGTQLVSEKGEPVVLRGISYGWHNWWPRFYNKGTVKTLSNDWNCSVLRAAMGVGPDSGYTKEPEWSKSLVMNVVEAAIDEGIYVIIDWHSHHIFLDEAKEFFSEMAKTYGDHPNIIYEIFNEPVEDSWEDVKEYSVEVIKSIREHDPDNIILVGSPHWDQDVHIVADNPIVGYSNLMYTLHFYAATHKEYLFERGDYALEKGLPLFVSESAGMEATGNGPIDYENWTKWIDWMEKNQISWITWSIADKDETCSMLKKSADSNGNWKDEEIKTSGLRTRELIKKYNTCKDSK